jgi:hypothetical protein
MSAARFVRRTSSSPISKSPISKSIVPLFLCLTLLMALYGGASQVFAAPPQATYQPNGKLQSQIRAALAQQHGAHPNLGGGSTATLNLAITSGVTMVSTVPVETGITLTVSGTSPAGQLLICTFISQCTGSGVLFTAPYSGSPVSFNLAATAVGCDSFVAVVVDSMQNLLANSPATPLLVTPTSIGKRSLTATIAQTGGAGNYTLSGTEVGSASSPTFAAPTGTISFLDASNSNAVLATAPLGAGTMAQDWTYCGAPSVGFEPQGIVMADLNGDGKMDLATTDLFGPSVTVYLGNGDGTFTKSATITTGQFPTAIAVGNFGGGHGNTDLAVTNGLSNSPQISIFLSKGDGTFTAGPNLALPGTPGWLAVGPSSSYIAAASGTTTGQVTVFVNNGGGSFGGGASTGVPPNPLAVVVTPTGLAITNFPSSGTGTVTVLTGSPGSFTALTPITVGTGPAGIAIGDFTGTGVMDLIVANEGDGTVSFLTPGGASGYTVTSTIPVGQGPFGIVVGDFNGDGKLDFATANKTDSTITIMLGNGSGGFTAGPVLPTGQAPAMIAAGDVNGDGTTDIVNANSADNTISVLLSRITQTATATATGISVPGTGTHQVDASYPGDTNYGSDVSPTTALTASSSSNPVPTLSSLSPNTATVGSAGFSLTVNGTNFVNASVVNFNGAATTTTFVSSTQLNAAIPSSDLTTVSTPPVTVTNPTPGGGTSNAVNFTISSAGGGGSTATTTAIAISSGGSATSSVASGSVVTLTATVLASGTAVTVGNVNFCNAAAASCTGTNLIGSAQLTSGGTAAFKFIPAVGSHSYEAVFAGNGTDAASASPSSPLTVTTAGKATVTTTLAESGSPGNLTLTATVAGSATSSASPAPTGTVSFIDTTQGNSVLGTGTLGAGTFGENWTISQTPQVGANPKTVLVSDLNGDGIPDVVVGNNTNVSILTGKGDGTFNAANNITALASNPWIAVAPFVNGGPLDILAVSNAASPSNNAEIIIGNGTGGGTAGAPFSLPFGTASGVVSGDFNGDGQQDFAVIFQLDNKISTFLGNGNGTFQAPTTLATGSTPVSAVVGNFNGHGKIDVAVANSGDNTISIYLGSTSGAETASPFTVVTPVQANFTLTHLAVGDFNGDGIDDLAATGADNHGNAVVAIYFGKGAGAFSLPTVIPELLAPSGIVAADVLGNGKLDIVVTKPDGTLDLFLNDGAGDFSQGFIAPSAGNSPMFLAAGNFNGQATQGLAVANNADGTVSVFLPQLTQSATASISGVSAANPEALSAISTSIAPQVPGDSVVAQYNGDANFAGSTSTPIQVAVNNPIPTISGLSPAGTTAGSGAFTLTVTGTNFIPSSSVLFNGIARATTFVSATQLTAAILASDVASVGTPAVIVSNPTPGGGQSNAVNFSVVAGSNPVPAITNISPANASAGSGAFTLTVNGTNFVSSSSVLFNGAARTTTFVSATQLTAAILATDITSTGTPPVVVTNPTPGGGQSNSVTFTITAATNPVPTVTSLSPTGVAAGSGAFTLTMNGTNFVSGATVNFGGANKVTTFVSSTQLTAAILAADVATAGTPAVFVNNPNPGGGPSNSINFNVSAANNPVPTLTSVSPTTVSAGVPSFTMTLTGTNFVSTSVVDFNGAPQPTTFVNATTLTATISAAEVQSPDVDVQITVVNPAPGGGTSNHVFFNVTTAVPALSSLSPNSAIAGGPAFTLTVNGSLFENTATVQWNGANLTTTFVSATQLTAAVPATDIASAGTASVVVFNPQPVSGGANARRQGEPAGTFSNALSFTINASNPVPTLTAISPTSTGAGGAAFTLTLTGTNFISGSTAQWKGSPRTTTFVSATQLTAAITAADIAASGTAAITVVNPAPGGGTSNSLTFTITDFSVSATTTSQTVTAGQSANFTIGTATVGGAFPSSVTFSASGLPTGASASFSPSSVTPGSSTTLTITTTARGLAQITAPPPTPNNPAHPMWLFTFGMLLTLITALASAAKFGKRTARRLVPIGAFVLLLISVGYISGCSGAGFPKIGANNGTPAGTYTITVTGTSGADVHSTTVTLIVQ